MDLDILQKSPRAQIFTYSDPLVFLKAMVDYLTDFGQSFRSISRLCGFKSPSYLPQVLGGQRNLTPKMAERIAEAFRLDRDQKEYFLALVKLIRCDNPSTMAQLLAEMQKIIARSENMTIDDYQIQESWIHGVVFELAKTKQFKSDSEYLASLLRVPIPPHQIEESLEFLNSRKYLKNNVPKKIQFRSSNDIRRIDLQRKHLQFLKVAQHRLNDGLSEREFQGLTMAARREDMPKIKEKVREFIASMNDEFAVDEDADSILRLQCAAFFLTK